MERQTELAEGSSSFLEECGVRMHDLKNLSDTEPAVSIQVFSPPLTSFTFHSERGTERRDLPRLTAAQGLMDSFSAWPAGRARSIHIQGADLYGSATSGVKNMILLYGVQGEGLSLSK